MGHTFCPVNIPPKMKRAECGLATDLYTNLHLYAMVCHALTPGPAGPVHQKDSEKVP